MKRRVKKENIIILLLSLICIALSILLMISVSKNKKDTKSCTVEEKNSFSNKTTITCGDDNDIARFMCSRFHEEGYIVTFSEELDDNAAYSVSNELLASIQNGPTMYVSKEEINNILRNVYGVQEEKDYGVAAFIFVPNHNIDYDKLKSAVKNNKKLDKIIEFKINSK